MVDKHEENNKDKEKHEREDMFMCVVWIGHTLYLEERGYHIGLGIELKQPKKCTDGTDAL